jgi:U32 family peptidase
MPFRHHLASPGASSPASPGAPQAPELLLPAGSPEKLTYAIAYGADAVFLGLPMASLRTPSKGEQFTPQNLGEHIHRTQAAGVKAYVTANIFANNRDLDRLALHFEQLETMRPDAIILSDPGVFRVARKYAPSVPVHLSTQANTLNREACAFWQDLGVERVILAREVPVREMAEIHAALPDLQLECFVHGSLCVAYSGRCVISDYLTDNTKNSNKGMCGNSCRWEFGAAPSADASQTACAHHASEPDGLLRLDRVEATRPDTVYTFEEDDKGTYMLNSKDLCLVSHLRALMDAGMVSFKVEGRTKSVYYVAAVGRTYRDAIDWHSSHPGETPSDVQRAQWQHELAMAGNRGFTEGFLNGRPDETAYQYHSKDSQQTAQFLAVLQQPADGSRPYLQAKNPFSVNEPLEVLTPQGILPLKLTEFASENGLRVETAQTNHRVYSEVIDTLPAFSILRRTVQPMGVTPSGFESRDVAHAG